MVNFALVQLHAQNAVKRGENEGKQLYHVNIVRDFKSASAANGNVQFVLPAGLSAKDCMVIAFAQNKKDLSITNAAEAMIASVN